MWDKIKTTRITFLRGGLVDRNMNFFFVASVSHTSLEPGEKPKGRREKAVA